MYLLACGCRHCFRLPRKNPFARLGYIRLLIASWSLFSVIEDKQSMSAVVEDRPYKCPGCDARLGTDKAAALEHMKNCAPLQDMIAVGQAGFRVRFEQWRRANALRSA